MDDPEEEHGDDAYEPKEILNSGIPFLLLLRITADRTVTKFAKT